MKRWIVLALLVAGGLRAEPDIGEVMAGFVEQQVIAGGVTLVADADGVVHLEAHGLANRETGREMRKDDLFWIASMTKPVTGTAVMMMVERGLLGIDAPVSKYLPEFGELRNPEGEKVEVTVRQLLTHSSGLAELSREEALPMSKLAEVVPVVVKKPVNFEPGSQWKYCQSSINTGARLVEVLSGKEFPDFLEQELFKPLRMSDTTFYPSEEQAGRLATSYKLSDDGELEAAEIRHLLGRKPADRNRLPLANAGLFTTAADYGRFCRMILGGGQLDGRRYLSEDSVKTMTSVLSGNLETGFTPGNGWGLGWCVVREPQGVTAMLSPGTFGHGGAYGTQAWVDPVKQRIYLLLVQRANFPNSDNSEVRRGFQQAAVAGAVR